MVMLRFNLQSLYLNLTLNLFQIQITLRWNKLMTMKWTIPWNSSTQNAMMIFWIMTSRYLGLYYWSPLLQNFIQPLLCCFINMEEKMLLSQISCHPFLCLSQPRPLWNFLMETRYIPKELVLFYVIFLTFQLYIQWEHFIIFQVALTTPSHQVP